MPRDYKHNCPCPCHPFECFGHPTTCPCADEPGIAPINEQKITQTMVEQIANIVSDYYDEDDEGRWLKCAEHIASSLSSTDGKRNDATTAVTSRERV